MHDYKWPIKSTRTRSGIERAPELGHPQVQLVHEIHFVGRPTVRVDPIEDFGVELQ